MEAARTDPRSYEIQFTGGILQRGFWLYVWEVTPPGRPPMYYVGRTGDSSSTNAQSPFNRMSQHLGFAVKSNALRRHLGERQVDPETCTFRLVSIGPLEEESRSVDRTDHDRRRDVVAAMERALAEAFLEAGCDVLNRVTSRKDLDSARFQVVLVAFAAAFPRLATRA